VVGVAAGAGAVAVVGSDRLKGSTRMAVSKEAREVIQGILEKLLVGYAPQKVVLFGSHAYGNPQPDSDIDLLIIKDTSERFLDRWITVRRILSDPERMVPLETFVLTPDEVARRLNVGDQFLAEILEKGKVLYAA
jgi:predicted nucleotidyltransferase